MIPGLKIIDDILKGLPENARLRSELSDLRAEVERLHAANEKLQSELGDAQAEIQRLKQPQHPGAWGSQPRIKGRMER